MAASATEGEQGFVSALRFRSLNRAFDPVVRVTMRESRFKRELLDQAAIEADHRVLDVGCGTGTLAIMAKQAVPEADVLGLDGDPDIIGLARRKAESAGIEVRFDQGYSTELPYDDGSFDRVLSTLFFHHLTTDDTEQTVREVARVLKPGGELHLADFTRPRDPVMAGAFLIVRVFDGVERTRVNARGRLGALLAEAGFESVIDTNTLRTGFGTLGLIRAVAPGQPDRPRSASS